MTSSRQPARPASWAVERHCTHCNWWVAKYLGKPVRTFHTQSGAQAFIDNQPHGNTR